MIMQDLTARDLTVRALMLKASIDQVVTGGGMIEQVSMRRASTALGEMLTASIVTDSESMVLTEPVSIRKVTAEIDITTKVSTAQVTAVNTTQI